MSEGGVTPLEEALRLRPTWINSGTETPGQTGSVVAGMLAVAGGLCNHVLCFRTVWEATATAKARAADPKVASSVTAMQGTGAGARVSGDIQWRFPFGATSAANWIGMNASAHFHKYGTTRETLGWIALNARANAGLNPAAIYRDPLTMDDYLNARMITTPFGLYDCDVPADGSVAIIVSRKDLAADLRHAPVLVDAVGTQITERISWDQGVIEHEPLVTGPAAHLWTRTALRPSDVDVAELYDGFSFNCLSWIEALGFCGFGEAKDFLDGGKNIALDGELPLNTHGGQLSAGRLHGYGFLHEAIVQLRGDGGERQVAGAEVARGQHRRRRPRRLLPADQVALTGGGRACVSADAVERERALAGDRLLLRGGQRLQRLGQLVGHPGELGVGVRIVRRPHDAVGAAERRVGGERQHRLVGVEADPALPAEVLRRRQLQARDVPRELDRMVVEAFQPRHQPTAVRLEEEELGVGEPLGDAARQ